MFPILFRIPIPAFLGKYLGGMQNVPIYSYGVMLGLSLVVGWYLTLKLAEKDGLPKEVMANCYVVTALAAIVGSRLLYVVTNLSEFEKLADVFAMRRGGLVAYGGFLGGFVGSWLYLKRHKINLMPWADVAVPSLASGLLVTRIGCYLFGCDFGRPLTSSAPAWLQKLGTFPHWAQGTLDHGEGSPAWVHHVQHYALSMDSATSKPVHPTQLYESLVGLVLLALLLLQRRHQRFRGQVFMLFVFSYGILRFLLEIVRDDAERGSYGPHLAEHVFVPGALALFAVGYTLSFANAVENVTMRRFSQIISFIPAVVAYLALRPASFAEGVLVQLSTSQWVAVLTGLAVCVFFALYWKAAEAHPDTAMALDLDAHYAWVKAKEDKSQAADEEKQKRGKGRTDDNDDDAVKPSFDDDDDDDDDAEPDDKHPSGDDDSKKSKGKQASADKNKDKDDA